MQFANIMVAIAMVLLGYAVFVFTAETYNPFAIPAKNSSENGKRRRFHLVGLLAGCLVALSCLAAWILGSGNFLEGLKVSFIVATISLFLVLGADTVLNWFRKRQVNASQVTQKSIVNDDHQADVEIKQEAVDLELNTDLKQDLEDKLKLIQHEHSLELIENTNTINELETSIAVMQKERDALTEKAIRLDDAEAELKSARDELIALKERDQESIRLSQSTIEKLRAENLNLQNEVEGAKELKLELENNRLEFSKLKSENENQAELRSELVQREKELQKKLHQAALKERAGRIKMEASAKRALVIARQAVTKLNEHEKKIVK